MTEVLELAKENFKRAIEVPLPFPTSANKNYKLETCTQKYKELKALENENGWVLTFGRGKFRALVAPLCGS